METKVKFNRQKTKEQALQGNSGTIYFTTDKSIVLDGQEYGGSSEVTVTDEVQENNYNPISSHGVYTVVGNIQILLETI